MENLARELQKDNKKLRVRFHAIYPLPVSHISLIQEDGKRLAHCVEDAQDEVSLSLFTTFFTLLPLMRNQITQMKNDMAKRIDKAKLQDVKFREMPDIVVKVVCRYRAELFFKISRKTKLSRLFNAWTDRMESNGGKKTVGGGQQTNGSVKSEAASTHTAGSTATSTMQFVFTHNGRAVEADQTPEEAGMEDGDEILAVELMDLTEGPASEDLVSVRVCFQIRIG